MPRDLLELDPGEELLAVARASFRGAAAMSARATLALGAGTMRMRAYDAWHDAALASGFPMAPPDMVVAATDRRVLFGKPTFLGRTPSRYWGAVEHEHIAEIAVVRHGLITGVAFGFHRGAIVEIEAVRARKLRRLVEIVNTHLPRH